MIDTEFDTQVKMVEGASQIAEIETSFDVVREYLNASHIAYTWRNQRKKLQTIYSSVSNCDESLFSDPAFHVKLRVKRKRGIENLFENFGFYEKGERWVSNKQDIKTAAESTHIHTIYIFNLEGYASVFTFSKNCSDAEWAEGLRRNKMLMTLYARAVAEKVHKVSLINSHHATYRLSGRETDVISTLARGLSRSEAAHVLQISEHTIRTHVEGAKRKLGARNTVHAVASAVASGAVPCPD